MPEGHEQLPATASPIQDLIEHLSKEKQRIEHDLETSNLELKPVDIKDDKTFFALLETRKYEIEQITILLERFKDDPIVIEQAGILSEIYEKLWEMEGRTGRGKRTEAQMKVFEEHEQKVKESNDLAEEINRKKREEQKFLSSAIKVGSGFLETLHLKEKEDDPESSEKLSQKRKELSEELEALRSQADEIQERWLLEDHRVDQIDIEDDFLDERQRKYIRQLSESNDPDALFETYVYSQALYRELTKKILAFEKKERDENIDKLIQTLIFYRSLASDEFKKNCTDRIHAAAEEILKNQSEKFTGMRGLIQSALDKTASTVLEKLAHSGIDTIASTAAPSLTGVINATAPEGGIAQIAGISATILGAVTGNEDSLGKYVMITALKAARELAKPVTYSPELVQAIEAEALKELEKIPKSFDLDVIDNTLEACQNLKTLPSSRLSESEAAGFMAVFDRFAIESTKMMRTCVTLLVEIGTQAYLLSHGSENSRFEADSQFRAKFLQYNGKDFLRMAQIYSPFGVFLPEKVQLKPKDQRGKGDTSEADVMYLSSGYGQGFWKEHPYLAPLAQAGIAAGGTGLALGATALGYGVLRAGGRVVTAMWTGYLPKIWTAIERFVPETYGALKRLGPGATVLAEIEIGYGFGKLWKESSEEGTDEEILTMIEEYLKILTNIEVLKHDHTANDRQQINEVRKEIKKIQTEIDTGIAPDMRGAPVRLDADSIAIKKRYIEELLKQNPLLGFEAQVVEMKERIRQKILLNEISKRRKLFQAPGYDLKRNDIGEVDIKWVMGGGGDYGAGLYETMLKNGSLREAFIAANKKLLLLSFEPYVMDSL